MRCRDESRLCDETDRVLYIYIKGRNFRRNMTGGGGGGDIAVLRVDF